MLRFREGATRLNRDRGFHDASRFESTTQERKAWPYCFAASYTDVMTRDNKGFYLRRFEALLKSLENVVPGSGLLR